MDNFGCNTPSALASLLGVGNADIKFFTYNLSGTSDSPITVCQEVVSIVPSDGRNTIINCLHTYNGTRYVSGYVYSNKDYGYFTIVMYNGEKYEIKLENNTYTVIQ